MSLPRIIAALADLRKALAAVGANQPFEIVIAPDDEAVLREFFAQWPSVKTPPNAITEQAGVVIRVRQRTGTT
jgi:hypothetical protein